MLAKGESFCLIIALEGGGEPAAGEKRKLIIFISVKILHIRSNESPKLSKIAKKACQHINPN